MATLKTAAANDFIDSLPPGSVMHLYDECLDSLTPQGVKTSAFREFNFVYRNSLSSSGEDGGGMYRFVRTLMALALLLAPIAAFAQDSATITGTVKDASGAVLPGVTVEASSPALIEKVRSVTTNDTGQYSIVALPPGTYTITFT